MSEYLSKKVVLDAIETEQLRLMGEHQSVTGYHKRYVTGKYDGLNWVKHQIQSGAFNADESEIQRLRAALEWYTDASWTDFEYDNGDIARQALGREANHEGN